MAFFHGLPRHRVKGQQVVYPHGGIATRSGTVNNSQSQRVTARSLWPGSLGAAANIRHECVVCHFASVKSLDWSSPCRTRRRIFGSTGAQGGTKAITCRFVVPRGDGPRRRVVGAQHAALNGLPWSVVCARGGARPLDRCCLYGKAVRRSVSHTGEIAIEVCAID